MLVGSKKKINHDPFLIHSKTSKEPTARFHPSTILALYLILFISFSLLLFRYFSDFSEVSEKTEKINNNNQDDKYGFRRLMFDTLSLCTYVF